MAGRDLKIAVLICRCGTNIAGVVDVDYLVKEISRVDGVVCYEHEHWCSEDGLLKMREVIKDEKPDRVVIAACTPHLHEELFRENAEKAGLNGGYVKVVNIREQCSWVHYREPRRATIKALELIRAAIAAAPYFSPIKKIKVPITKKALVIGGGVSGITASLSLAEKGIEVYLVEREGFLGGHMAKLDKVFPTMDCSICILGPLMSKTYSHPKIKVLTLSEVKEVEGVPGNFRVKILKRPRYVDEDKCNGCNKCLEVCPIEVPNEYNYGLGYRKAIVKPVAETVPIAPYIDMKNCILCMSCAGVCEKEAIDFDQKEELIELNVGTIILATGFEIIDPKELEEYGYGKFRNVILGIELERLVNPDGPTRGRVIRISDGKPVRRAAIILCAGSRDERHLPYCCKFGCMAGLKHAVYLTSLIPKIETPIVVDALLGTGVKGKLREPILQAVKIINKVKGFKVSIDLPTGIDASTGELLGETVKADLTITFHKPKTGLIKAKNYAGKIVVASIGIPVEAETYAGPGDVKKIWKPRPSQTHKGDFGRLLIVGGSKTYTGAPAFAALAAYKVGVDLVWVATPTQTAYTIATYSPEIITIKLEGENFNPKNLNQLKPYIERATTLLVGPGLGTEKETFEAFWLLIGEAEKCRIPVVLDADGLKAYSQQKRKLETSLILTPHQAEFTMLTEEKLPEFLEDKTEKVKIAARKLGCILLVKGWIDLISDGEKVKLNQTGNPGMTVGGTGDILAGILAGLIAQKINPFDAACAAAFLNGAAGDLAYKKKGYSLTPTDMLEEIPTLLQNPMKHKEAVIL